MPESKGIDVSSWQGDIQWNLVKKAGVDFAILRTGYGTEIDKMFEKNIKGAQAQGIPCGVYHYSMATTTAEAEAEAKQALTLTKPYLLAYPVAFDLEDKVQQPLSKEQRSDLVDAFCGKVGEAERHPMVYTSVWWMTDMLEQKRLAPYDKWVAQWAPRCTYRGGTGIWQNTNKGRVPGIMGDVDLDIAYQAFPLTTGEAPKSVPPVQSTPASNQPIAGTKLVLKNLPRFLSSDAAQASGVWNGIYWIYDGKVINGKIRLTNRKEYANRSPMGQFVTGYLRVSDMK